MYFEDHNPPHFHVLANDGREAQVRLGSLRVLNGEVDKRALAEAREWGAAKRGISEGDLG